MKYSTVFDIVEIKTRQLIETYMTDIQLYNQIYLMPWHYNGITTAMQEEKRKEKKEQ